MGKLLGKVERGAQSHPAPFKSQSFPNLLKEGRAVVPGWCSWSTLLAGVGSTKTSGVLAVCSS